MAELLGDAQPMVNLLWRRETDGKSLDSPERRAALDKALREAIFKIKDKSIRSHYGAAIAELRRQLFQPNSQNTGGGFQPRRNFGPAGAHADTKSSALAQADTAAERLREQVILVAALRVPNAVRTHLTQFEKLEFHSDDLQKILNALLDHLESALDTDDPTEQLDQKMASILGASPLETLSKVRAIAAHPYLQAGCEPEMTERTLTEELSKLSALRGARTEIADAVEDMEGLVDEGLTWRLGEAAKARSKALRAIEDEDDMQDTADEGLADHLQQLIDSEVWKKNKS